MFQNVTLRQGSALERMSNAAGHVSGYIAATIAWQRTYWSALAELDGLSNQELDELGLRKDELRIIARNAADRHMTC